MTLDDDRYLTTFLAEMEGYARALREQAQHLASPTRFGATADSVLQALRHLGHTITDLATTRAVPDFMLLGAALHELASAYQVAGQPPPVTLAASLTYLTVHIEERVKRMERVGHFAPPDDGELHEAQRIASLLADLAPRPAEPVVAPAPEVVDALEAIPPELRALVEEFLQADLASATSAIRPAGLPPTPTTLHDFIQEMTDDLAQMRRALVALHTESHPHHALRDLGERAHKLKGAAYMVGMVSIGALGDMLESLLLALRQEQIALDAAAEHWLLTGVAELDALRGRVVALQSDGDATDVLARLHESYAQLMATASEPPTLKRPVIQPVAAPMADDAEAGAANQPPARVRVDPQRLDRLMATINSLLFTHVEVDRLHGQAVTSENELDRAIRRVIDLYDRLRGERVTAITNRATPLAPGSSLPPALAQRLAGAGARSSVGEAQAQLDLDRYSEFDLLMAMVGEVISDLRAMHLRLQTALNQLKRQSEHQDVLTESLQRDVLALRLVSIAEMLPRLQLAARMTALTEGKEVEFSAEGAEIEIDGEIFAILDEHLVQIVRNAVVHGIETPAERQQAGKLEPPRITVRAEHDGDGVRLAISDNGRGLNPQRIVAATLLTNSPTGPLLTPEEARNLTPEAALNLMFLPDVSTALEVRPNAGRGMGLPSVKRSVESVRGSITVTSEPGVGTTFTLRLPTSLGMLRGRVVQIGAARYAIPAAMIARTVALPPEAIVATERGARAPVADEHGQTRELPVINLAALLELPALAPQGSQALIVIVDGAEYAVVVDAVGEERDLALRRVPRHLRRRGVRGATITAQGELHLILDLTEIISHARDAGRLGARQDIPAPVEAAIAAPQGILVVDDSPSVRQGVAQILSDAGYQVATARDGLDAIAQMRQALPQLLILDVEMPQLNGYELLEMLRGQPSFAGVRAIMLTSRAAPRYRELALNLGALDYLVKPVTSDQLLAAVAAALDIPLA